MNQSMRIGVILSLLLGACSSQGPVPSEQAGTAEGTSEPLLGNTTGCSGGPGYWTGSPPLVPVCWENPTASDATFRGWIQKAVQGTWQRLGRVNFTGWGTCGASDRGIRIQLTTSTGGGFTPITPPGKCTLDGVKNGMLLNPTLSPEHAAASIGIHEFGHALGFYHEEERPEASHACSPACNATNQLCVNGACIACPGTHNWGATASQQEYGQYDYDSVMSYCGQQVLAFQDNCGTCAGAWKLKPGGNDYASLQAAYGLRIPGQLVTPGGNCLALANFNPGNTGAQPFLWACDEVQDDQEWERNVPGRSFKIDTTGTGNGVKGCLWSGTGVEVRDCDGSGGESWDLTNVELRGWGNKCLDLRNGDTTNGNTIQIFDCFSDRYPASYNVNQRWNMVRVSSTSGNFELHWAGDNTKCATVSGGTNANGTRLVISTCNSSASQRFFLNGTESILYSGGSGTGRCWDAQGVNQSQYLSGQGGPYDTAPIQLFDCNSSTLNQRWHVSGQIRNAFGVCLTHNADGNGVVPTTSTCATPTDSRGTQIWDYYL